MEEIPIVCRILWNNRGIELSKKTWQNNAVDRLRVYKSCKKGMWGASHKKIGKSDKEVSLSIITRMQHP